MALFSATQTVKSLTQRDLSEFIPFFNHIDHSTLLTKNGEVLQVLKITGTSSHNNYETNDENSGSLRAAIRNALMKTIHTSEYAVWIHTIRRRTPIQLSMQPSQDLARYFSHQWHEKYQFDYAYHNEIYVSILRDGQDANLFCGDKLKGAVMTKANRAWRNQYIDESCAKLYDTVEQMISHIAPEYSVKRLSLVERLSEDFPGQPVFFSEPMEFLGHVLNSKYVPTPTPLADISTALLTHKITFGYNAVETRQSAKNKRFSALLTLKHYHEMPNAALDHVLQLPVELVISEACHFIDRDEALKPYAKQQEYFDYSSDDYGLAHSGLIEMLVAADSNHPTDFINRQISVSVSVDEYKKLDSEVTRIHNAFSDLGLITIREDIKLEECFWAQLPGNFEFLRRDSSAPTSTIACFARLNLFSNRNAHGNHWGEAIAAIPTIVNSPYFLNLHFKDNGHTLFCDFNDFQDNVSNIAINYLITATRKYNTRLFVFDRHRASQLTINMLEGHYHTLHTAKDKRGCETLKLNPFSLPDNARNRGFLIAWIGLLIGDDTPDDVSKSAINNALERLFALPRTEHHLKSFIAQLIQESASIAAPLEEFIDVGTYAGLFDGTDDSVDIINGIHGFDVEEAKRIMPNPLPLFAYMLHRIIVSLDGRPTMIVIHDSWTLLENSFFGPRLASLLEMLKQNNTLVIFQNQQPLLHTQSQTYATLQECCATHFIIPSDAHSHEVSGIWKLGDEDRTIMRGMDRLNGHMVIKQGTETTAIQLNFRDYPDMLAIFANELKSLMSLGGPFAKLPKGY